MCVCVYAKALFSFSFSFEKEQLDAMIMLMNAKAQNGLLNLITHHYTHEPALYTANDENDGQNKNPHFPVKKSCIVQTISHLVPVTRVGGLLKSNCKGKVFRRNEAQVCSSSRPKTGANWLNAYWRRTAMFGRIVILLFSPGVHFAATTTAPPPGGRTWHTEKWRSSVSRYLALLPESPCHVNPVLALR